MRIARHLGAALPALVALVLIASPAAAQAPPPVGGPLPGLTPEQLAAFNDGRLAFTLRFTPPTGLGPVFNDDSCAICHGGPAGGPPPGSASPRVVTRFGRAKGRSFDPLESLGGSLIQVRSINGPCGFPGEVVPPQANVRTDRRTTALFGLGLVDAVPDATFEQLAASQAATSRRTAGRVNHVVSPSTGTVRAGRFGWKAQVASLFDFSGDALLNEQGITNPLFPNESCPQGDCSLLACNPAPPGLNDDGSMIRRLTAFQRLLAPPARGPIDANVAAGEQVFNSLGCNSCHVATLVTGPSDVAALDTVTFHPYSDFLLHDMGRLGDGIAQGEATGSEIRTAPLWGVSRQPTLLHDGRAQTLEEAIDAHDGQAASSRREWSRLSASDRELVLTFLRSL